jgi:hypothetical protein
MTTQPAKKMHDSARSLRPLLLIAWIVGSVEALLAARLTIQLFAARPDNPALAMLLMLTAPLRAPLAFLDAGQPRYGAVLEYSTLVTMLLVLILGYLAWIVLRTATVRRHRTS